MTLLERQQNNQARVNVYLDGVFAFGLNEVDAAHLHQGQELAEVDIAALRVQDAVIQAVDKGIRLLTYRPRSIQEVRRHLLTKGIPATTAEAALQQLASAGYLDDRAFARYWIDQRTRFKPLGPRALRYELRQKGVEALIIDELLAASVDPAATAYQAAFAQARKLRGYSRQAFRTKLGAFLQRRGFAYSTASDVIRQVMSELAEADSAFFATADDLVDDGE